MSCNSNGLFAKLQLMELEDRHTPASTTTTAAAASLYALGIPQGQTGNVVVYNASGNIAYQNLVSDLSGSGTTASPYQGVLLSASLSGTALSLDQLSVFSYVRAAGGTLFRSPTPRGGAVIELRQS